MEIKQLKPNDDNINWNEYAREDSYNADLLEYLIAICDEHHPSIITDDGVNFDLERSESVGRFARRYLNNQINIHKSAIDEYLGDEELMSVLAYYGLDVTKFWYYSVWAKDYVENLTNQTVNSASEEFNEIISAIEQTDIDQYNTSDKAELKIKVTKKGSKPIIISTDNRWTISAIYYGMKLLNEHLENNEPFSIGTDFWYYIFNNDGRPISFNSLNLAETYNVKFFWDQMMLLLKDKKKVAGQKKAVIAGDKVSVSKDFLISKMVYYLRLSKNKDYIYSPTFLRTTIKNVDVGKYDPVNNVYSL